MSLHYTITNRSWNGKHFGLENGGILFYEFMKGEEGS